MNKKVEKVRQRVRDGDLKVIDEIGKVQQCLSGLESQINKYTGDKEAKDILLADFKKMKQTFDVSLIEVASLIHEMKIKYA